MKEVLSMIRKAMACDLARFYREELGCHGLARLVDVLADPETRAKGIATIGLDRATLALEFFRSGGEELAHARRQLGRLEAGRWAGENLIFLDQVSYLVETLPLSVVTQIDKIAEDVAHIIYSIVLGETFDLASIGDADWHRTKFPLSKKH
jgi:hypothetical protein